MSGLLTPVNTLVILWLMVRKGQMIKRWYGLYKLDRVCKYIAREATIARWVRALMAISSNPLHHEVATQYENGLLDAGGILMEAKDRIRKPDAR